MYYRVTIVNNTVLCLKVTKRVDLKVLITGRKVCNCMKPCMLTKFMVVIISQCTQKSYFVYHKLIWYCMSQYLNKTGGKKSRVHYMPMNGPLSEVIYSQTVYIAWIFTFSFLWQL